VLPQEDVEAALDRILMVGGPRRLNQLRDHAREIAPSLGYEVRFKRLDSLIGASLGTHEAKILTAKQALARAKIRRWAKDQGMRNNQVDSQIDAQIHNFEENLHQSIEGNAVAYLDALLRKDLSFLAADEA
jgi:hypothetical protein